MDWWLIGRFEAFAHWLQRRTGRTNFFLYRLAIAGVYASFAAMLVLTGLYGPLPYAKSIVENPVFYGIILIVLGYDFWDAGKRRLKAFKRLEQGLTNPEKKSWFHKFIRVGALAGFVFYLLTYGPNLAVLAWFFLVWSLYLEACDPLLPTADNSRKN